jgi:hypothetical protein
MNVRLRNSFWFSHPPFTTHNSHSVKKKDLRNLSIYCVQNFTVQIAKKKLFRRSPFLILDQKFSSFYVLRLGSVWFVIQPAVPNLNFLNLNFKYMQNLILVFGRKKNSNQDKKSQIQSHTTDTKKNYKKSL